MELWQAVQDRLALEKRMYKKCARKNEQAAWMLKGLVRCSNCGSTLCYQNMACPSMQCYKYAHGQCSTSHSLSIAKANRTVIAALEQQVSSLSFNIEQLSAKTAEPATDVDRLIKLEQRKLTRIQEAYEAGIDTLQEYAEKKRKVQADIDKLKQLSPAPVAKAVDKKAFARKVESVIELIKSPDVSEEAKNEALRTIISKIVYDKPAQHLDFYFYI